MMSLAKCPCLGVIDSLHRRNQTSVDPGADDARPEERSSWSPQRLQCKRTNMESGYHYYCCCLLSLTKKDKLSPLLCRALDNILTCFQLFFSGFCWRTWNMNHRHTWCRWISVSLIPSDSKQHFHSCQTQELMFIDHSRVFFFSVSVLFLTE